jgi:hypothetical protein
MRGERVRVNREIFEKKEHWMNNDDAMMRIDEEEEEEDDPDDGDVRLQGLFHDDVDGNREEEEMKNDAGETATSGNDSRKRRRLDKNKVLIHEDSIIDCFHLAVASHNANSNSHQPSIIKQGDNDDVALPSSNSTSSSVNSFRWRPPLLYATTTEPETADASTCSLAEWQPQTLELPLWAIALVRPSNQSLNKQRQGKHEDTSEE